MKLFRVYLSKNRFKWSSAKLEVVRTPPQAGAGETLTQRKCEAKKENYLISCSLKSSGLFVIGCP